MKKISQIKNEIRDIILLEAVFPGSVLIYKGKDKYSGVKSLKDKYDKSIEDLRGQEVYFSTIRTFAPIKELAEFFAMQTGANPDDLRKIDKAYIVRAAEKYGLIDKDVEIRKKMSSASRPNVDQDYVPITYRNPEFISCPYCMKDDIKYGATICTGCKASIIYTRKNTTGGEHKVISFLVMITMMVVVLGFAIATGTNPSDIGFGTICVIAILSLVIGRSITSKIFGGGHDYETYKFERPKSYFVTISHGD